MRPDIYLLYLILRLLGRLPLRVLHGVGAAIGRFSLWRHGKTVRNTEVNLQIVRPDLDEPARKALLRQVMEESGKSITEIAKIWGNDAERVLELVREVRGEALMDEALAAGKGLIIAAPHLGCWELLNYWLCKKTPMAILYRPPRIAAVEQLLRKARGALAPEQVRAEGAGVRTLFKRLGAGGTVGILPDQKPREGEGQFAPFFGREALTMVLLPRLAARTGATVLFSFAERLPHGEGYRIHLLKAPEGLAEVDQLLACTALNEGVEACVRLAFAQYQWHYKRYSANDRPSPYG
ncbi:MULTISPECIES: lipid A biosynthesis acyltransferase [Dyella]|uniref:Lipid A biosynthesis acyltransferase n=2 Tax=Dyella TaxID=231454 RepID=A0A4R0YJ18_9GAMM|nr:MULTISPECIES: lipid A biosynthesis acyltransferase [Dyella]TBR36499.1 lipid A biosynthesis acyltransferase [Dyella terrae]TCI08409.1 lipid A biosynthesis acyltransferase [Dyella soli]